MIRCTETKRASSGRVLKVNGGTEECHIHQAADHTAGVLMEDTKGPADRDRQVMRQSILPVPGITPIILKERCIISTTRKR